MEKGTPFFLKYVFSVLLALATVFILFAVFGFYWDDSNRFLPAIFYSGISAPTHDLWFNEVLLFQIPIIVFLSNYFDKIPVYGIWHLVVMIIYLSLWFHLSMRIFSRIIKSKPFFLVLPGFLSVYSIVGLSFIYVGVSRDSILMASGSLLLYLDYYLFDHRKRMPLVLLFLFGCMLRVSSGILVLMTVTLLVLLISGSFKKTAGLTIFHWVIVLIFFLITQTNKALSHNTGLAIEQTYEYAIQDRGMVIPLSEMKSPKDSVRYMALTGFFLISDSAQINLNFIKRVAVINQYLSIGITKQDVSHLCDNLLPLLSTHKFAIIFLYLLLISAAWHSGRKTIFNIIIINIFWWFVVLGLGIKMNMADHFLLPWISVLFGISLFLVSLNAHKPGQWQKTFTFLSLILISIVVTSTLCDIKKQEIQNNQKIYANLQKLGILAKTSVPVMWDYDQVYFPTEVLSRREPNVFKSCIYQTMFFIMYYQYGQEKCLHQFGFSPLDWRSMNIAFHKNHEKVRIVAEERTADFLGLYYKTLYNLDFKLVKDLPINEISPNNFVYHLDIDSAISGNGNELK